MGCDTDAPRQAARNLTHSWPDSPRIGTMRAPYRMTAPVSETRLFQTLVDALDVPRHAQRRVAAALRRELKAMSAVEIEAFQRGFDVALAELRTPELWSAVNVLREAADPHDFDSFAAWLAMQGRHVVQRALRDPDGVLAALSRSPIGRRRNTWFDDILTLPREVYGQRFDRDLFDAVPAVERAPLRPLAHPDDEDEQPWPHPDLLPARFPQLWRRHAARGLRVQPWVDEGVQVCSCCGAVHRVGYGVLFDGGRGIGSYGMHWIEGAAQDIDLLVALGEDDRQVAFALCHSQHESNSGMSLLDREESWFDPHETPFVGSAQAREHPLFGHVLAAGMAIYQREPRLAEHRLVWGRRTRHAPAAAQRLTLTISDDALRCADCGQVHDELELSHRLPDAVLGMDAWQWRHRIQDDGDRIVLDGRRRFERGLLPLRVEGRDAAYHLGIWIERLDPSRGNGPLDGGQAAQRLQRGPVGRIANDVMFCEHATLALGGTVLTHDENQRPKLVLDDGDHPLVQLQRDGMPADLPRRLLNISGPHRH